MGNTDSKTLSHGPAGQHTQALNNSPSYTLQDGFHLLELHGGTSIKFILIILVVALIALAVKLGLWKRLGPWTGQQLMKQMSGDVTSNLIPMGNSRTTTFLPVPNHQHRWVDQLALDLRLMEQWRLFKMMFRNAIRAQRTARVASMPRAQIFKVPAEQTYLTFGYKSGKQNRWPEQIISKTAQDTNTWPKSRPQSKSSGGNGIRKSTSTEGQESFEIIEVHTTLTDRSKLHQGFPEGCQKSN